MCILRPSFSVEPLEPEGEEGEIDQALRVLSGRTATEELTDKMKKELLAELDRDILRHLNLLASHT